MVWVVCVSGVCKCVCKWCGVWWCVSGVCEWCVVVCVSGVCEGMWWCV